MLSEERGFCFVVIGPGRSTIPFNHRTRSFSAAGGFLLKTVRGNPNREVVADIWVGWPFAETNTAIRDDRGVRSRVTFTPLRIRARQQHLAFFLRNPYIRLSSLTFFIRKQFQSS